MARGVCHTQSPLCGGLSCSAVGIGFRELPEQRVTWKDRVYPGAAGTGGVWRVFFCLPHIPATETLNRRQEWVPTPESLETQLGLLSPAARLDSQWVFLAGCVSLQRRASRPLPEQQHQCRDVWRFHSPPPATVLSCDLLEGFPAGIWGREGEWTVFG